MTEAGDGVEERKRWIKSLRYYRSVLSELEFKSRANTLNSVKYSAIFHLTFSLLQLVLWSISHYLGFYWILLSNPAWFQLNHDEGPSDHPRIRTPSPAIRGCALASPCSWTLKISSAHSRNQIPYKLFDRGEYAQSRTRRRAGRFSPILGCNNFAGNQVLPEFTELEYDGRRGGSPLKEEIGLFVRMTRRVEFRPLVPGIRQGIPCMASR
jgi:hypothetical protein